jgi:hypothetical protein
MSSATLDNFTVKDDGKLYFVIDGHEWPARKVNIEVLRKFAAKNDFKRSQPPVPLLQQKKQEGRHFPGNIFENGTTTKLPTRLMGDCSFSENN